MTRTALPDGHPRRLNDARTAWRKMSPEQRRVFLDWIAADEAVADGLGQRRPHPVARPEPGKHYGHLTWRIDT